VIISQYQNGIETYLTFNFLRRLLLYHVLNFQVVLDLRNYFRIQQIQDHIDFYKYITRISTKTMKSRKFIILVKYPDSLTTY